MRKVFPLALLLLSCLCARGQVLWERTWGGVYDDACEVRNTRDGGMVALVSYGVDSWLLRLDANGDSLWTRRFPQPLDLCAVTETHDGGFLLTGTDRVPHRDIVAWKLDHRGDSLWMRTYPDTLHTEGMYTVIQQPDSSFLIGGYTSDNSYDMLVLHIDSLGNLLWRRQYGSPDFEGGTSIAPCPDGSVVLCTTSDHLTPTHILVVKIDAAGDTLWTRHYPSASPTGGAIPQVTQSGDILVTGWIQQNNYDNYLLRLDSLGNVRWARSYGGIGFESRTARGTIEDRFGGYTMVSSVDISYGPSGNDFDIAVYRLDTAGNVQHIHRVGGTGDDMPRYFEQAANGDYLLLGYSTSFTTQGQQSYLARLSPTGCSASFYDLAAPLRDTVCPGDTLLLDAGPGFVQWLWSDGITSPVRPVATSDTFFVTATDSAGCIHHSNAVTVLAPQGPTLAWAPLGNGLVQFGGTAGNGQHLLWDFGDGGSDTAANPVHMFAQSGMYWVCRSTLVPGCGVEQACDSVSVTVVGLPANAGGLAPRLFPNPTAGLAHITNPNAEELPYALHDAAGRMVATGSVPAFAQIQISTASLPVGLYGLQFQGWGRTFAPQKLVVAR